MSKTTVNKTNRFIVHINVKETSPSNVQYAVYDTKEDRNICYCTFKVDADMIAKSMNVSNSWEPILSEHERKSL